MSLEVLHEAVDEFESKWLKNRVNFILSDEDLSEKELYSKSLQTIEAFQKRIAALRIIVSILTLYLVPFIYFLAKKKPWLSFVKVEEGREDLELRLSKGFEPLDDSSDRSKSGVSPRKWAVLARFIRGGASPSSDQTTKPGENEQEDAHAEVMVKKRLGRGGFGVVDKGVYRDATTQVEQVVAIKTARKIDNQEAANNSLLEEAKILEKFQHPNIVSLIATGTLSGDKFSIVLEYADNKTLHKFVSTPIYQAMTWDQKKSIPVEIATALDYMHNTFKMVHRDIKGSNVLVFSDPLSQNGYTFKLCDFGATVTIKLAKTKKTYGTLNWFAPEVLDAKVEKTKGSQTTASDVWAFGLLLLMMFKPGEPFKSFDDPAALLKYFKLGSRAKFPKETPPEIRALIKSCWKFKPDDRPKIKEIKEDLEATVTAQ